MAPRSPGVAPPDGRPGPGSRADMLPGVLVLAANAAVQADIGLLAFMLGTGLLVNALIVYIVIQALGEKRENADARRASTFADKHRP